jgi:hypothetical protein
METKAKEEAKKLFDNMIYSKTNYLKKKDATEIINDKIKFFKLIKKELRLL